MVSIVSYAYSGTISAPAAQQSAGAQQANTADGGTAAVKDSGTSGNRTPSGAVVISLSSKAQATLTGKASTTKSFADVTVDARATLDKNYAAMQANGKPYDYVHATQDDVNKLFGSLDRRSLYAVASNSGGKFTQQEQDVAQSIMSQQEGTAMGLYEGPVRSSDSPYTGTVDWVNDPAAGFAAGIAFMDGVSPEEKASANWVVQRAALQFSYQSTVQPRDGTPKNVDSGNPIVNMLVKAFQSMKDQAPRAIMNGGYVKNFNDLKNMPLFPTAMTRANCSKRSSNRHNG